MNNKHLFCETETRYSDVFVEYILQCTHQTSLENSYKVIGERGVKRSESLTFIPGKILKITPWRIPGVLVLT